ncbi:hypothetical protein [Rubrivirga sp. IMCC43871]|uniref:hypothetical protein n=1 Tax=Rubrivirga sp. IMCC43871 TaxID=3391575 RepID=UPI00398FB4CF
MLRTIALLALATALGAAGCASADAPAETPRPDALAAPAPPPEAETPAAPARPTSPVTVEVGGSASVEGGRTLRFVEVVEDSRCPEGVQCVQAGRARIRVAIGADDAVLSVPHELMRDGETATAVLDGLTVTLQSLDPYPGSAAAQAGEPVRAVLAVR